MEKAETTVSLICKAILLIQRWSEIHSFMWRQCIWSLIT